MADFMALSLIVDNLTSKRVYRIGQRVRHLSGSEATIIERPADASPSIQADAVWTLHDLYGVQSHRPEVFEAVYGGHPADCGLCGGTGNDGHVRCFGCIHGVSRRHTRNVVVVVLPAEVSDAS